MAQDPTKPELDPSTSDFEGDLIDATPTAAELSKAPVATQRRRFIYQTLAFRKELAITEILEKFPETGAQSLKNDLDHLINLGLRIVKKRVGRQVFLVDDSSSHFDVKNIRAGVRVAEKELAAGLALGLVVGFPSSKGAAHEGTVNYRDLVPDRFRSIPDRNAIQGHLHHCAAIAPQCREAQLRVSRCLDELWAEHNRLICIDSGTTNDHIAKAICELPIPSAFCGLSRLTVCTNDAEIFHQIGNVRCQAGSMIVGGLKKAKTDTIAGALSEGWLRSANLHFGVSIVGAALLDVRDGHCYCNSDSQEEANLKALLFQMSTLRLVCVDDSKFTTRPMRAAFPYASITPSQVDAIVTNCPRSIGSLQRSNAPAKEIETQENHIREFSSIVGSILRRGVPVLLAESKLMENETVLAEHILDG